MVRRVLQHLDLPGGRLAAAGDERQRAAQRLKLNVGVDHRLHSEADRGDRGSQRTEARDQGVDLAVELLKDARNSGDVLGLLTQLLQLDLGAARGPREILCADRTAAVHGRQRIDRLLDLHDLGLNRLQRSHASGAKGVSERLAILVGGRSQPVHVARGLLGLGVEPVQLGRPETGVLSGRVELLRLGGQTVDGLDLLLDLLRVIHSGSGGRFIRSHGSRCGFALRPRVPEGELLTLLDHRQLRRGFGSPVCACLGEATGG